MGFEKTAVDISALSTTKQAPAPVFQILRILWPCALNVWLLTALSQPVPPGTCSCRDCTVLQGARLCSLAWSRRD